MSLLDRLRKRHYRRRFGPEGASLVQHVEAQVRALPLEVLSTEWIEWFWRQPPDTWERLVEERRNWTPPPEVPRLLSAEEAFARMEAVKVPCQEITDTMRETARSAEDPAFFEKIAEMLRKLPPAYKLDPCLTAWLASLPCEAREGGAEICGLLMTMDSLRKGLAEAIRREADETTMDRLRWWIRTCDRDYREVAEPFFAIYGRPSLRKDVSVEG